MVLLIYRLSLIADCLILSECLLSFNHQQNNKINNNTNNSKDNCSSILQAIQTTMESNSSKPDIFKSCKNENLVQNVSVICRDERYVYIEWTMLYSNLTNTIDYIIESNLINNSYNDNNKWINKGQSKTTRYKVEDLDSNSKYKFRITPYVQGIQLGQPATSSEVTTFNELEVLEPITNISIGNIIELNGSVSARLKWLPAIDLTCQTTIIKYEDATTDHTIQKVIADHSLELNGLSYLSQYKVTMFTSVGNSESEKVTYSFETPSCLHLTKYDMNKCVPDPPTNLSVKQEECIYFDISWDRPIVNPESYKIIFQHDEDKIKIEVPGNETSKRVIYETHLTNSHPYYYIYLIAVSPAGKSKYVYTSCEFICNNKIINTPSLIEKVNTEMNIRISGNCNPEIFWNKSSRPPDYYFINVKSGSDIINNTIRGDKTNFKLVEIKDGLIEIDVIASRSGEISETGHISSIIACNETLDNWIDDSKDITMVVGPSPPDASIISVFITLPIILLIICWIINYVRTINKDEIIPLPEDSYRKKVSFKKFEKIENIKTQEKIEDNNHKIINESKEFNYDEYEVDMNQVRLCCVLGEGEFGVVHKAVLFNGQNSKYVAVKMLKNKDSIEEKRQLEKEIEVMKSVGKHRNIVSLLGCCTEGMMLIVEYCCLGDLRRYLEKAWRMKAWAEEAINDRNNTVLLKRNAFSNILYEQSDAERRYLQLSIMDLLSFARQIALGMGYLSENRVVHRDLAARNVLLTEDMTAKIADFGLSRDIYERNIYTKRSSDRLPLRWMAIESLLYHIYSTKSDVWSYGILLWEIMTLGGCPYPSLQTAEMYKLLQEGYRMERPKPCNPLIYDIMLSCWDAKPQNRPMFSQIVEKLEAVMKNESNKSYLDLSTIVYKTHLDEGYDINE